MFRYVIITPAHNEEPFIRQTISSVVDQRVLPQKWVIVDDASTDRTGEIVREYLPRYPFIELIEIQRAQGRNFGNKARAFNRGLEQVQGVGFDFIGNLDADIGVQPDYFESVLQELQRDPHLGIAGGMVHSRTGDRFLSQQVALDSVAGAVQLFRYECFRQIGGYVPLPNGGIDSAAEIRARMMGWKVQTFPHLIAYENRRTGSATARPLALRIKEGKRFRCLGYSFSFFAVRCVRRVMEPPAFVGSIAALLSFFVSMITGEPIGLSAEAVQFLRQEQRNKLKAILLKGFQLGASFPRQEPPSGRLRSARGVDRD